MVCTTSLGLDDWLEISMPFETGFADPLALAAFDKRDSDAENRRIGRNKASDRKNAFRGTNKKETVRPELVTYPQSGQGNLKIEIGR